MKTKTKQPMQHDLSTQKKPVIGQEILTAFFEAPNTPKCELIELIQELPKSFSGSKYEATILEKITEKISQEQGYISLLEYQFEANKTTGTQKIFGIIFKEIKERIRKENANHPSGELIELLRRFKAYKLPEDISLDLKRKFFPDI